MADILKAVMSHLPEGKISDAVYEGANIVLYTKDKDFFLNNSGIIKQVVDDIKKRVELRPDPAITLEQEEAERIIRQIIPQDAGIDQVIFDPQRSQVIIEAEKPGLAIGKQGALLREIRAQVLWVPHIRRKPAIKSQLIEDIRSVLYQNSDYRRKFLDRCGHRIYDGWRREKKNEWVRVSYLGSGRQVGRSCILLQTSESRVMLDCGINVAASGPDAYPMLEAPEFNILDLDAVIISHAHLDHSGFLPYLFKYGFKGPVYCTAPTRDVMALLQLDLIKIAKNDGRDPLFTSDDVKEMVKHTIIADYDEVTDITPDIRITMYNAGHILGSAMVHLHIGNGLHNLLYSADTQYAKTSMLSPAITQFPRLETLLIESTYGGKDNVMPPRLDQENHLKSIIKDTLRQGGKVLIPVLGTGRAQEVMVVLEQAMRTGQLEKIPVYIDGMVWDITAIHTAYPEYLKSTVRKQIFHKDQNPFLAENFSRVGSAKERQQLLEETGSCVVLATSGMLVGGPSVQYFKALANNERNTLIFSSYQAEGSLGSRIQRGEKEFVFRNGSGNEVVSVKMEVVKLEITGHSDRKELMNFVYKCNPRPKRILINHGENSRALNLASSLHNQYKIETLAPRNLDAIRIK